jgi:hypothetical protein
VLNQLTVGRKPLNLTSKEQIPDEMWGKDSMESTVIIKENELLCGVLGKKQFGLFSQPTTTQLTNKEKVLEELKIILFICFFDFRSKTSWSRSRSL